MAPVEKGRFYKRFLFEVVIAMVKDKKNSIKNTMSMKISFMHYIKWTRVMLPIVSTNLN